MCDIVVWEIGQSKHLTVICRKSVLALLFDEIVWSECFVVELIDLY